MYFYRYKTFARSTAAVGSRFSATECVRITRINVTDLQDAPAAKTQLKHGTHNIILKVDTKREEFRFEIRTVIVL